MIFRQLFEPVSSTWTYLLGCESTGQAMLIDPVLPAWQQNLSVIRELGLELALTLDTHIHADHISAAARLRRETGCRIAHPAIDGLACADVPVEEGAPLALGSLSIEPLFTPGHTDGHHAYRCADRLFSGDALLIDGCGRTDFQNGDPSALYHSVRDKLFTLPDETLVYPAHDYQGRRVSSIGQEKTRNPRLGGDRSLAEFEAIMAGLQLAYPRFIDFAVPGNRQCGVCPPDVPENLAQYCAQIGDSPQG
ncbi:MAG: MBL fold metallo-hydrolase [Burkholderiales bacterium]|nr:MAG: MBL fold metallo-hydrolase [Burkholderiales bacterium]